MRDDPFFSKAHARIREGREQMDRDLAAMRRMMPIAMLISAAFALAFIALMAGAAWRLFHG